MIDNQHSITKTLYTQNLKQVHLHLELMENDACFEDFSSDQEYNDEANRKKPLDEPNSAQRQQYPHQSIVCITWTSLTSSKKLPSFSALRSSRSTTHPKIPYHGTGWFITPHLILTCAHNLYDLDKKQISQSICISFGDRHSSSDAIPITDFRFSGEYKSFRKQNKANLRYDYGLIKLQKPVKLQKYFILCINFSNQHEKIKTFGYPEFTRTSEGGVEKYVCSQKGDFGDRQEPYILKLFDWKMKHFLNTREGLSGSPIILGDSNDSNLIVGIHKASVVKKGDQDKNFLYNVARRIDQEMVDNIKIWAAEMKLSGEDIIVVDYEKIKGEQFLQRWGLPQPSPPKMLEEEIGQKKQSIFPYNCIGYLQSTYDEDIICGTGFLIAPDLVLTLLSSLFTKLEQYSKAVDSTKIRNPSIFFYLESQKQAKHLNCIEVQEIAAFPERLNLKLGFVHNHITSYCLLKLKQKIARKQYFKLSLEEHQLNTPLQMAGYLCPFRKQYDYLRSQWKVEHQIVRKITTKVYTRQLQTSMKLLLYDTLGQAGMVGSPLWDKDGHVQAIHHGILTKQPIVFAGRTITLDLVSQLYVWKDKLHGSSFETVFQGQNGRIYVNSLKALEDSLISIMSRSLGYSDQF